MSSTDSGLGDTALTPRHIQKRLFNQGSSSKRNLFQVKVPVGKEPHQGYDSDLGPMSPLSDHCSLDSSPGRVYESPLATPENSPQSQQRSWDRLLPRGRENYKLSPFSSLKKTTREARNSPRRRILTNSPRSIPGTPEHAKRQTLPVTPDKAEAMMTDDGVIPETPQKDGITQTPKRDRNPERKLITPLGSVCKSIIVPPLHRRKSLGAFDSDETSSPERNPLKRHLNDENAHSCKLMKTDDSLTIPKARAALFPEQKSETARPQFTLSTKSFYNKTSDDTSKRHSICFGWRSTESKPKKRHSLPARRSGGLRRPKFGEINAGVMHGIRRPKPRRSVKTESPKEKKSEAESSPEVKKLTENVAEVERVLLPMERPPSPTVDPNKRFFKTNRTLRPQNVATVTVSDKIKLKVSDGKIALNERPAAQVKHASKKPKLDISFDTADLTVDEPEFTGVQQTDVADILKILEDDWADDEYDTMGPLVNSLTVNTARSPCRNGAGSVMMSPGSVLSDMTSSMNIGDQVAGEQNSEDSAKYFPLFSKGYRPTAVEDPFEKKPNRGIKRQAWQLSKANGGIDQYQLDAGQKKFGTTQCLDCGIVYQIGEPEDENAHLNFHNSFKTLKFNGWKNERVVQEDPVTGSRVITIEKADPKVCWKKIEDILAVVDRDLGLADMELTDYHDKKIYLYIRNKTVIGVLIAETVKTAHRMIPELVEFDCCSAESTPAKCGVNVIWTAMSHRRQRVATKLLDALRTNYYYGYILSLDDIAFSIPTPSGKIFAEKYTGTRNFKVYS